MFWQIAEVIAVKQKADPRIDMNINLVVYIFLTIVVGIGGTVTLFQSGRVLGGLLFLVGAILLFVFYGLRWFEGDKASGNAVEWPPVVNTCPDYLTFFKRQTANGTQNTCIDTLGIARGKTPMSMWPPGTNPENAPSDDKYYFNLDYGKNVIADLNADRCDAAIQAGVTWEGITDGEVCTFPGAANTATGGTGDVPKCVP